MKNIKTPYDILLFMDNIEYNEVPIGISFKDFINLIDEKKKTYSI